MVMCKKKAGIAALAAIAVISGLGGLAPSTRADMTVGYYTSGYFDTTGAVVTANQSFTTGTNLNTVSLTANGETTTLAFAGIGNIEVPHLVNMVGPQYGPWDAFGASLGNFVLTASGTGDGLAGVTGITFKLDIFQVQPTAYGVAQTLVGQVGQVVLFTSGGAEVNFNTANSVSSVILGSDLPVTYTLNPNDYRMRVTAGALVTTVTADLWAPDPEPPVPLPGIASMGMPMFGLLAGGLLAKKSLKRRVAV